MSTAPARHRVSTTALSVIALGAGVALGALGHAAPRPAYQTLAMLVEPAGVLFVNALQVLVIPLVVATLLAAVTSGGEDQSLASLGLKSFALFVALLAAGAAFAILVAPPLIALYAVDSAAISALTAGTPVPQGAIDAALAGGLTASDWVTSIVPRNIFDAAARGAILPLLLFTVFVGLAVSRLPEENRAPLARLFKGLADAMLVCIRWVLVIAPIGVFALIYPAALRTGTRAAGLLIAVIVVPCAVMILFAALLYPVTAALGRTSVLTFARGVAPAQLVALTTRSSLAALPALIQGAREILNLPARATSFVLPFAVSVFKINRPLSGIARLLVLAHFYGIPLTTGTIAIYIVTIILISFATAGVPATPFNALPAYVAAGIPIEAFVISEALDVIPDMVKTWINVTGDMSVAVILSR